jgi:hypothetical protein
MARTWTKVIGPVTIHAESKPAPCAGWPLTSMIDRSEGNRPVLVSLPLMTALILYAFQPTHFKWGRQPWKGS